MSMLISSYPQRRLTKYMLLFYALALFCQVVLVVVDAFLTPLSSATHSPKKKELTRIPPIPSFSFRPSDNAKRKPIGTRILSSLSSSSSSDNQDGDKERKYLQLADEAYEKYYARSTTKEKYLQLANEAYQKYYSKASSSMLDSFSSSSSSMLSKQDYLELAMNAWSENTVGATAVINEVDADGKVESSMDDDESDAYKMGEDDSDLFIDELADQLVKPPAYASSKSSSSASSDSVNGSLTAKDDDKDDDSPNNDIATKKDDQAAPTQDDIKTKDQPFKPFARSTVTESTTKINGEASKEKGVVSEDTGKEEKDVTAKNSNLFDFFASKQKGTPASQDVDEKKEADAKAKSSDSSNPFNAFAKFVGDTLFKKKDDNEDDWYDDSIYSFEDDSLPYGLRVGNTVDTEEKRPVEPVLKSRQQQTASQFADESDNAPYGVRVGNAGKKLVPEEEEEEKINGSGSAINGSSEVTTSALKGKSSDDKVEETKAVTKFNPLKGTFLKSDSKTPLSSSFVGKQIGIEEKKPLEPMLKMKSKPSLLSLDKKKGLASGFPGEKKVGSDVSPQSEINKQQLQPSSKDVVNGRRPSADNASTDKPSINNMYITEGSTAEDAERIRQARLKGEEPSVKLTSAEQLITEGSTAEEAEKIRNERLTAADDTVQSREKGFDITSKDEKADAAESLNDDDPMGKLSTNKGGSSPMVKGSSFVGGPKKTMSGSFSKIASGADTSKKMVGLNNSIPAFGKKLEANDEDSSVSEKKVASLKGALVGSFSKRASDTSKKVVGLNKSIPVFGKKLEANDEDEKTVAPLKGSSFVGGLNKSPLGSLNKRVVAADTPKKMVGTNKTMPAFGKKLEIKKGIFSPQLSSLPKQDAAEVTSKIGSASEIGKGPLKLETIEPDVEQPIKDDEADALEPPTDNLPMGKTDTNNNEGSSSPEEKARTLKGSSFVGLKKSRLGSLSKGAFTTDTSKKTVGVNKAMPIFGKKLETNSEDSSVSTKKMSPLKGASFVGGLKKSLLESFSKGSSSSSAVPEKMVGLNKAVPAFGKKLDTKKGMVGKSVSLMSKMSIGSEAKRVAGVIESMRAPLKGKIGGDPPLPVAGKVGTKSIEFKEKAISAPPPLKTPTTSLKGTEADISGNAKMPAPVVEGGQNKSLDSFKGTIEKKKMEGLKMKGFGSFGGLKNKEQPLNKLKGTEKSDIEASLKDSIVLDKSKIGTAATSNKLGDSPKKGSFEKMETAKQKKAGFGVSSSVSKQQGFPGPGMGASFMSKKTSGVDEGEGETGAPKAEESTNDALANGEPPERKMSGTPAAAKMPSQGVFQKSWKSPTLKGDFGGMKSVTNTSVSKAPLKGAADLTPKINGLKKGPALSGISLNGGDKLPFGSPKSDSLTKAADNDGGTEDSSAVGRPTSTLQLKTLKGKQALGSPFAKKSLTPFKASSVKKVGASTTEFEAKKGLQPKSLPLNTQNSEPALGGPFAKTSLTPFKGMSVKETGDSGPPEGDLEENNSIDDSTVSPVQFQAPLNGPAPGEQEPFDSSNTAPPPPGLQQLDSAPLETMPPMEQEAMPQGTIVASEAEEPWLASIGDGSNLPFFHVGNRIRSNVQGTSHEGYLVLSLEGDDGLDGNRYSILPCVAQRPWSIDELNATVPSKVSAFEQQHFDIDNLPTPESWELEATATSVRRYYEVEIHVFNKFDTKQKFYQQLSRQKQQDAKENGDEIDASITSTINDLAEMAIPKFLRVYPDDGSGGPRADDAIPEYGLAGTDVWGKPLTVGGHEWLVYEGSLETEVSLQDALEMNDQNDKHRLFAIQEALGLPSSNEFGDTLDVVFGSLLENLVFLSACNIVHRDLRSRNILCDSSNKRLRLTNFGNAVDLDPPRVGLDNERIELDAPGSIANTLAADIYSVALLVMSLLFDMTDTVLNQQLKGVGYDLDAWLQKTADLRPNGFDHALEYLGERPGLWSLLKGSIRPNPMRKKITSDSLKQFNEVMGVKKGETNFTSTRLETIAREESYLSSVIDPSSIQPDDVKAKEKRSSPPNEQNNTSASNDEAFVDITRVPFTLTSPTQNLKSTSSTLSELSKRAEEAAAAANANPNAKVSDEASSDDTYDVTRLNYLPTPTRKSLLTDMLTASYTKRRAPVQKSLPPQSPEQKLSRSQGTSAISPGKKSVEIVQVICPSGKLGVVVDEGSPAFVSYVSENSPLRDQIFLGDIIIGVDDEEVQQLDSDDVSRILLSKSANALRKITLLREIEGLDSIGGDFELIRQADAEVQAELTGKEYNEVHNEEVGQWLLSHLPGLKRKDIETYCQCLSDDGFDSVEMMSELVEEDLTFMKKAHQRLICRKLFGSANTKTPSLPPASSASGEALAAPKKQVFKAEEVLGEAARKGIQTIIAEEKRLALEAKARLHKLEEDKVNLRAKVESEAAVKRAKKRQAELDKLAEDAIREAETKAWLAEQNDLVKQKLGARVAEEKHVRQLENRYAVRKAMLEKLAEESKQLYETERWLEDQNRLVEEHHRARIAKEKQLIREKQIDEEMKKMSQLKENKSSNVKLSTKNLYVTEGSTAEEARRIRQARLKGKETSSKPTAPKPQHVTDDNTSEEVEQIRNGRLPADDNTAQMEEKRGRIAQLTLDEMKARLLANQKAPKSANVPYITEGSTAEEAERIRKARLNGDVINSKHNPKDTKQIITEGSTAEEAEMVRIARLAAVAKSNEKGRNKRLQVQEDEAKEKEAWLKEQNKLVRKRLAERLASESLPKSMLDTKSEGNKQPSKHTITEGTTAEEAELIRKARLRGDDAKEIPLDKLIPTKMTEGITAEEAELIRNTRLADADNTTKSKKS